MRLELLGSTMHVDSTRLEDTSLLVTGGLNHLIDREYSELTKHNDFKVREGRNMEFFHSGFWV